MSGIFGIVDPKSQTDVQAAVREIAVSVSHRDWFITEWDTDPNRCIAFGRVGIGIFNKDPQPVWNSSRTVGLVMAGELYKREELPHNDLSKTDEQMALALYERLGEDFILQLNGAFVIGIYDERKNRFLIANDRFGLYPLFYTFQSGRMIFAPEMKGILSDKRFNRRLDLTALAQYVRFQHLLGERTFFEDISLLPSASLLSFDLSTGSSSIRPYWSFHEIPYHPDVHFMDAVEETGMLFRKAVKRLSSDSYTPGVYLSGGLDSRSILGLIERRPVNTLTYGVRNCRDVYYAEKISKIAGSNHHWVDLPNGEWVKNHADFHLELTEGFHSWIHAHGISSLPLARELMEVNLTGWGGGILKGLPGTVELPQVFGDDSTFLLTRLFHGFNQKYTWPSITEAEENLLYVESLGKQMKGVAFDSLKDELISFLDYRTDVRAEYFYLNNHDRRLTHNFITFTRSHVETRMPFYDYDLFCFLHSIPTEFRVRGNLYRHMIQREIPKMAYIPYDHDEFLPTTNRIVRGVHAVAVKGKYRINRHITKIFPEKQTLYADYENYLRHELREWAENILFDRQTVGRGLFNPALMRSLMSRHCSGLEEWTIGKIAPLITYEMMLRRYYD